MEFVAGPLVIAPFVGAAATRYVPSLYSWHRGLGMAQQKWSQLFTGVAASHGRWEGGGRPPGNQEDQEGYWAQAQKSFTLEVLVLPSICSVTLDELLSLSGPLFPHL